MTNTISIFGVGDQVVKVGGDYTFLGEVRAVFEKRSGAIRYVVENDSGILHIFSFNNLRLIGDSRPERDAAP